MNDDKKAKWIVGSSGVVLSAILLTQISNTAENTETKITTFNVNQLENMSSREKQLAQLDWSNFEIVIPSQSFQSERKTKRS